MRLQNLLSLVNYYFFNTEHFSTYLDVLVSLVDEPLVHLIAETQGVVFDTEVSDDLQLIPGEYLL